MAQTAADILIETLLEDWGVRHICSLQDDCINRICEALPDASA